jgi:hypothetical protein
MTPLEKAQQLKESFNNSLTAKDCCLVALEEILNEYWSHNTERRDWWKQVKKHIDEL